MTRLILASGVQCARGCCEAAGVTFDVIAPHVDEDAVKESLLAEGAPPRDIADALAALKALQGFDVTSRRAGDWRRSGSGVRGRADRARCRIVLRRGSCSNGSRGTNTNLLGAVVLAKGGSVVWRHVARAELTMRSFSDKFLDDYLERQGDAILSSVGCYFLEGEGVQLFSQIAGDYFTILGLPMVPLLNALREFGALPT